MSGKDRHREQCSEHGLGKDLLEDLDADRGVDPERELHRSVDDGGEAGERAGQQRRHERADDVVALAPAPGQVADRHQRERGHPEGAAEHRVEQQPGREAADATGDGAAEQAEGDDDDRYDVGDAAEQRNGGEEGDLEHRREDDDADDAGDDRRGDDHEPDPAVRIVTWLRWSSAAKRLSRTSCCWPRPIGIVSVTSPMGMPGGKRELTSGFSGSLKPEVTSLSSVLDLPAALDQAEVELTRGADDRLDEPLRSAAGHLGRDRAAPVGDQLHPRAAAGDVGDHADEAVTRDHRVVDGNPLGLTGFDGDRRVPGAERAPVDARLEPARTRRGSPPRAAWRPRPRTPLARSPSPVRGAARADPRPRP